MKNNNHIWRYDCCMRSNTKFNPVVTELFIRGKELNISLVLSHNLILLYQKNIKQNSTHYLIRKIPNKWELHQIAFNHLFIDFQGYAS